MSLVSRFLFRDRNRPDRTEQGEDERLRLRAGKQLRQAVRRGNLGQVQHIVDLHGTSDAIIESTNPRSGFTALHLSVLLQRFDICKYLVESCGADANATTRVYHDTALMLAVRTGCRKTAQYLVETAGANVQAKDVAGSTALHLTMYWYMTPFSVIQYLVETAGANVEAIDNRQHTVLLYAVHRGKFSIVPYLVKTGLANVEAKDSWGRTALLGAIFLSRSLPALQCLIELCKADIEAVDSNGCTALLLAIICKSSFRIVRYLVESCGANVMATDTQGHDVLRLARIHHSPMRIVRLLEQARRGPALIRAIEANHYYDVQFLVQVRHVNVETTDDIGRTALHLALELRRRRISRYLVEHGHANVEAVDIWGRTALLAALDYGGDEIAALLITTASASSSGCGGCNVIATDRDGRNALHLAALHNQLASLQMLLERNCLDIESVDAMGCTAVLLASQYQQLEAVQHLLNLGHANIDARDYYGDTALHYVMQSSGTITYSTVCHQRAVAQCLVELGRANIWAVNTQGEIALHTAAQHGSHNGVRYFVETVGMPVDTTTVNQYKVTALLMAVANNRWSVVQYLVERGHANVEATDSQGKSVLRIAIELEHGDLIPYLVRTGRANVLATNALQGGETVLHWLAQYHNRSVSRSNTWGFLTPLVEGSEHLCEFSFLLLLLVEAIPIRQTDW